MLSRLIREAMRTSDTFEGFLLIPEVEPLLPVLPELTFDAPFVEGVVTAATPADIASIFVASTTSGLSLVRCLAPSLPEDAFPSSFFANAMLLAPLLPFDVSTLSSFPFTLVVTEWVLVVGFIKLFDVDRRLSPLVAKATAAAEELTPAFFVVIVVTVPSRIFFPVPAFGVSFFCILEGCRIRFTLPVF